MIHLPHHYSLVSLTYHMGTVFPITSHSHCPYITLVGFMVDILLPKLSKNVDNVCRTLMERCQVWESVNPVQQLQSKEGFFVLTHTASFTPRSNQFSSLSNMVTSLTSIWCPLSVLVLFYNLFHHFPSPYCLLLTGSVLVLFYNLFHHFPSPYWHLLTGSVLVLFYEVFLHFASP